VNAEQNIKMAVIISLLLLTVAVSSSLASPQNLRSYREKVPCIDNGRFYRNPNSEKSLRWSKKICGEYYLCIEEEVFPFRCSTGLTFDIQKQICDRKAKVDNCDVISEKTTPRPLLNTEEPICRTGETACSDGSCLPTELFCDGFSDCFDGSDEGWCDAEHDPNAAPICDPYNCTLPDCFCSSDGTLIPGGLNPSDVPQMITITFDDAVNDENWDLYQNRLFPKTAKNPNGCPIHGTFFISHQYTNYAQVQKLSNQGHEIAVHSITHRGPERWWGINATIEDWFDEMVGQANIINRFGGVDMEDIRGVRVPFLSVGWNRQFLMMREFGFVYDSSMAAPVSDPPSGLTLSTIRCLTSVSGTEDVLPDHSQESGSCLSTRSRWKNLAVPWWTLVLPTFQNRNYTRFSCTILEDITTLTGHPLDYISILCGSKEKVEEKIEGLSEDFWMK